MKSRLILSCLLSLAILSSCSNGSDNTCYYAFKSSQDGKWGMISPDGKVLFDEEFKMQPTNTVGGVFFAQTGKDGLWEMYNAQGKPTTVTSDSYVSIFPFYENVTLAVKKDEHITIIDKKGNVTATLEECDGKPIEAARAFHNGLAIFKTSSGYGAINTEGKIVIRPKYAMLNDFNEQMALGIESKYEDMEEDKIVYSVINTEGEVILSLNHSKYELTTGCFKHGLLGVCKSEDGEQRWGLIDEKGEEVVKPTSKNSRISDWNNKAYIFSDGRQWGLKKISDDEILIRSKYDVLAFANEKGTLLWAGERQDSKMYFSLISSTGDVLTENSYIDIVGPNCLFKAGFVPVQISSKEWGILNAKGLEQKLATDIFTIGEYERTNYENEGFIYSCFVPKEIEQPQDNTDNRVLETADEDDKDCNDQNCSEQDCDEQDYDSIKYTGTIGNARVTMVLDIDVPSNRKTKGNVSGSYYYGTGSNGSISLFGTKEGNTITLIETTDSGETTGKFVGTLDGLSFYGTFTNLSTGKESTFSLDEDGPNE